MDDAVSSLFEREESELASQPKPTALIEVLPLAARMRPKKLDEFVGQEHILGEGKLLRRMLEGRRITSIILCGPPGTGKTTLAELIANRVDAEFVRLNAVASGTKEVRETLDKAKSRLTRSRRKTLLFIDELHRFNRAQQELLLPDVESGIVSLVGATTENPSFALVSPLLSRSQLFHLEPLSVPQIVSVLDRALKDPEQGLGKLGITASEEGLIFLAEMCEGDARRALQALEIGALSLKPCGLIDLAVAKETIQTRALNYSATGDEHYDTASAFIKSIRGSDPDAALYWMARMLESGEDPRFIARRIVIAASEDIGNAAPMGLVLAQSAAAATEFIGWPECRIMLAQAVTYLATAPKSNASYLAIDAALNDVRTKRLIPVPMALRDAHYSGAKRMGHGVGYEYPHDAPTGFIPTDYLGVDREYYEPVDRGEESEIKKLLDEWRKQRRRGN